MLYSQLLQSVLAGWQHECKQGHHVNSPLKYSMTNRAPQGKSDTRDREVRTLQVRSCFERFADAAFEALLTLESVTRSVCGRPTLAATMQRNRLLQLCIRWQHHGELGDGKG